MQNSKGELHDYLVRVPWKKILEPRVNICMGVRWLFQKKKLASIRLKRLATWEEAIIEYKGYWDYINKHHGEMPEGIIKLREYYQLLLDD